MTDVLSRIYIRVSEQQPWIHKKPSLRRGVQFAEDVRFCFTVYQDYEQFESGDTLTHTFWLDDWPVCTTKWLYIWGMQGAEICVSTSPIFHYHNDGESPIPPPQPMKQLNAIDPEYHVFPGGPAWNNYDFSRDIPEGATGVVLCLKNSDGGVNNRVAVRKPGADYDIYSPMQKGSLTWVIVGVDDNRQIQYRCQDPSDLVCYLLGYTGYNVVFPDTSIDITPTAGGVHQAHNIGAQWSGAKFIFTDLGSEDLWNTQHSIRPVGSTKFIYQGSYRKWPFAALSADGKVECAIQNAPAPTTKWVAYGYIKEDITVSQNGINFGDFVAGAWKEVDFSGLSVDAEWGFIEVYHPFSASELRARKNMGFFSWPGASANHNYIISHLWHDEKCELYTNATLPATDVILGIAETH